MFWLFENDSWMSQKERVLQMLQSWKELEPKDFVGKFILRYWAHIFKLRKEGHQITTRMETIRTKDGKRIESVKPFYLLTK